MDIQHLRYFIGVAKHLNFTKAAEEFYIAQPAMSQSISSMEKQLGVKLFIRSNRSVRLTPAGKVFLEEAREIVSRYDNAVSMVQQEAKIAKHSLQIAYWGPIEQLFLPQALGRFRRLYPDITLSVRQDTNKNLVEMLESGEIDVVCSAPYSFTGRSNVACKTQASSPVCAVMSKNHPLAKKKLLDPTLLNGQKFIIMDMRGSPDYAKMMNDCKRLGFMPEIVSHPTQYETLLMMVESEIGITLMPRALEPFTSSKLHFVELDGEIEVEVAVAYLTDNTNRAIPLLLKLLDEEYNRTIAENRGKRHLRGADSSS
ncbi:MAG: LysR family transcriptional regulator [Oscillospiraceae bacterium]|nr:LysR family transcriptional regulator [Oscillospiraceae bacterium]